MKYFAFVEEGQNLENARQCPSLETAFGVAIIANTVNPMTAVRDSDGAVITVSPSQTLIKMDWLMKSDFVLVEVDEEGELCFTALDTIAHSKNSKYVILVYYRDGYYVVGNAGEQSISSLMEAVNPAQVQRHKINHMIGPVTISEEDKIVFEYLSNKFCITGSVEKDFNVLTMDRSLIPDGKLMVLNDTIGNATQMRFIGKFSSIVKLYENNDEKAIHLNSGKYMYMLKLRSKPVYKYIYYVQDSYDGRGTDTFRIIHNPKIGSVEL